MVSSCSSPRARRLQLAFDQLKARLQAKDCSSRGRKRELPRSAKIGVVNVSPSGAAIRDGAARGRPALRRAAIVIARRVQGEGAADEMPGLRDLTRSGDV